MKEDPMAARQNGVRVQREVLARYGAVAVECPHGWDCCPVCDRGVVVVSRRVARLLDARKAGLGLGARP